MFQLNLDSTSAIFASIKNEPMEEEIIEEGLEAPCLEPISIEENDKITSDVSPNILNSPPSLCRILNRAKQETPEIDF